jgi:hypothetical protein
VLAEARGGEEEGSGGFEGEGAWDKDMKKRGEGEGEGEATAGEVEETRSVMVVVDCIGKGWSTLKCLLVVVEGAVVFAGTGDSSGKDPQAAAALAVVAVAVVVGVSCIRDAAVAVGKSPFLGL